MQPPGGEFLQYGIAGGILFAGLVLVREVLGYAKSTRSKDVSDLRDSFEKCTVELARLNERIAGMNARADLNTDAVKELTSTVRGIGYGTGGVRT